VSDRTLVLDDRPGALAGMGEALGRAGAQQVADAWAKESAPR